MRKAGSTCRLFLMIRRFSDPISLCPDRLAVWTCSLWTNFFAIAATVHLSSVGKYRMTAVVHATDEDSSGDSKAANEFWAAMREQQKMVAQHAAKTGSLGAKPHLISSPESSFDLLGEVRAPRSPCDPAYWTPLPIRSLSLVTSPAFRSSSLQGLGPTSPPRRSRVPKESTGPRACSGPGICSSSERRRHECRVRSRLPEPAPLRAGRVTCATCASRTSRASHRWCGR